MALAQYIIRNTVFLEKLTYNQETGMVIYRSKMSQGKSKKNFQIYMARSLSQPLPTTSLKNHFIWCVTMAGIQTNPAGYEKNWR